jgi:hypothetical protein
VYLNKETEGFLEGSKLVYKLEGWQLILYRAPRKITNSQKSYGYKKAAQDAAGRNKAISTPI